jgi:hypothetical protein
MRLDSYLPISFDMVYDVDDTPSDGHGGPPPSDAGAIYVADYDDDSPSFEEVLHKTSISILIDELIEGHIRPDIGKIDDKQGIEIMRKVKKALQAAIESINDAVV